MLQQLLENRKIFTNLWKKCLFGNLLNISDWGSFILNVSKIFCKINISYPLIRTCEYQEVRNIRFLEIFVCVLNEWICAFFWKSSVLDIWQSPEKPLTHFSQCHISIPPENVRKPKVFLTFSGGAEMWHWTKMG